jgi:hypothetical protein
MFNMGNSVLKTHQDKSIGFHWDQLSNELTVNHYQDAEPIVNHMADIRRDGTENKKAAFNLFCSLPNTIVYDLKRQGIDIFRMKHDPSMRRRFLRAMQFDYPLFKATDKVHLG